MAEPSFAWDGDEEPSQGGTATFVVGQHHKAGWSLRLQDFETAWALSQVVAAAYWAGRYSAASEVSEAVVIAARVAAEKLRAERPLPPPFKEI